MARIRSLFLLLTIVGPLHMAEQLATDIEEFHMIRARWGRTTPGSTRPPPTGRPSC
jgi:hypothetical protein